METTTENRAAIARINDSIDAIDGHTREIMEALQRIEREGKNLPYGEKRSIAEKMRKQWHDINGALNAYSDVMSDFERK